MRSFGLQEDKCDKIEKDEGNDLSSEEKGEKKPEKSCIGPKFVSILTSVTLVSGACFSIDWTSAVYLLTGCLYFSRFIGARSLTVIIFYGIIIFLAEIIFLIILFTTNLSNNFDPFIGELLTAFGFPSATRSIVRNILGILPEGLVVVALILIRYLSRSSHEDESSKSSKPSELSEPKNFANLFLCHLWFWLMIGFLVIVYTFGNSGCYLVVSCTLYE